MIDVLQRLAVRVAGDERHPLRRHRLWAGVIAVAGFAATEWGVDAGVITQQAEMWTRLLGVLAGLGVLTRIDEGDVTPWRFPRNNDGEVLVPERSVQRKNDPGQRP